jgi:hypothetical protein
MAHARRFIRRIFAHLQEAATSRFPDNKQITVSYSIVGGFIFLRFFCSAIFSPFGFGVAGTHATHTTHAWNARNVRVCGGSQTVCGTYS